MNKLVDYILVMGRSLSTCIVYYSKHRGNTRKLLNAIKDADPEMELIDDKLEAVKIYKNL